MSLICFVPLLLVLNPCSVKGDLLSGITSVPANLLSQNPELAISIQFQKAGLDVVAELPSDVLSVVFGAVSALLGNRIPPVSTIDPPAIGFANANNSLLYALVIFDTAALNNLLFLRVNIAGTAITAEVSLDYLTSGFTVAPYMPVTPVPGSGTYEIVALLFAQVDLIDVNLLDLLNLGMFRIQFNLTALIGNYSLTPVAANFWTTNVPSNCNQYCQVSN